jgi:hypothetical protein
MVESVGANVFVGVLANIVATSATLPWESTKNNTYIKGEGLKQPNIRSFLVGQEVMSRYGFGKFFTGYDAVLGRSLAFQGTRGFAYLSLYKWFRSRDRYSTVSVWNRGMAAMIAGFIGGYVSAPFEIAVTRMQTDWQHGEKSRNYTSGLNAIQTILAKEGSDGLFRGATLNALRHGAYAGPLLMFYDNQTELWGRMLGALFFVKPMSAMFATMAAATFAVPFDNARVKYMHMLASDMKYKS